MPNLHFFYRIFPYRKGFCPDFLRTRLHDAGHFLQSVRVYHKHAWTHDSRFLPGNLRQRLSQILHVVVTDGRYDAQLLFLHHVRGVKPASKTRLQNRILHAIFLKKHHCHKKQQFKKGGMAGGRQPFHTLHHHTKGVQKICLGHYRPVDHKPLPHAHKMRRGKHTAGDARLSQDRRQISTNGALSVCACYV